MHIRIGVLQIPQTGNFELQAVGCNARDPVTARIGRGGVRKQSVVSIGIVGKQWFAVTGVTMLLEESITVRLLLRERQLPPLHPVVARVGADQRKHEGGDRLEEPLTADHRIAINSAEQFRIQRRAPQAFQHLIEGVVHLIVMRDRRERLHVEVIDGAVPHELRLPRQVKQRRRVADADAVVDPVAARMVRMRKSGIGRMTTLTRDGTIARQQRIVKERATEQHLRFRERVLVQ